MLTSLFRLLELKKLDVVFVQETHNDSNRDQDWRRERPGGWGSSSPEQWRYRTSRLMSFWKWRLFMKVCS